MIWTQIEQEPVTRSDPKLFLILVQTSNTSDLSFFKISSHLYIMLVLRCFVERNFVF